MNCSIKAVVVVILMFFSSSSWSMYKPEDDLIVNMIKQESNLTQADVDKWKFLWLGRADAPIAGAATLYTMSSMSDAAMEAHDAYGTQVKNILTGQYLPKFMRLPEFVQNVASSQAVWAGVGVAGVGFAAYKYLYPRIRMGILSQVKAYNDLCSRLGVT